MMDPISTESLVGPTAVRAERPAFRLLPLQDKIALDTGASSGNGKAIALALAGEGAQVCLVGRKVKALEDAAKLAQHGAPLTHFCRADLTRDEDIRSLAENLERNGGRKSDVARELGINRSTLYYRLKKYALEP